MADEHQARRRWIKLWTQETLYGTILKELEPDERAVWFEALCAAGDSIILGKICISERIPYSNEQLAGLFNVPLELLQRAFSKLETLQQIKCDGSGIIEILNWEHYLNNERHQYMAEYMRNYRDFGKQKGYSVPPNLRAEILERDDYQCVKCGDDGFLQVDHIIPFQDGGKTEKQNLQTLCRKCNAKIRKAKQKARQEKLSYAK